MMALPTRPATGLGREAPQVSDLIREGTLRPAFQPIVALTDGAIHGYEALIRTPPGCVWPTPDQLFGAAKAQGLSLELELECLRQALVHWSACGTPGRLFLNLSAQALVAGLERHELELILSLSGGQRAGSQGVVIELTEHERVHDVEALAVAVGRLRRHQVALALDDFGDGRSSLRLWSELKPEVVKIDKYFTGRLSSHPEKVQTLRALKHIAEIMGSRLVAEGIETVDDLRLVRDLGICFGQGWALGRPQAKPAQQVPDEVLQAIRSRDLAVFPERRRQTQQRVKVHNFLRAVEPVAPQTTNQDVFQRFDADPDLVTLAVVDNGLPVGLIGRQGFVDRYAKPYFRELFGRRPCLEFANPTPKVLEMDAGIDELTAVLTSADQRYLSEGFILAQQGRYRGVGLGEDLVRAVTESRIEAARHANPLTLLPGNIPLTQHIKRLLQAGRHFVAAYCDLNHFKPYNDQYGYWRGDEMINLAARCIVAEADPLRDFVGHVGGDDFVVLFQSENWQARCQQVIDGFGRAAREMYDEQAREAGGVLAEDRFGVMRFHPLTSMSIGAVRVGPDLSACEPEDVANAAARAKRLAKASTAQLHVQNLTQASLP